VQVRAHVAKQLKDHKDDVYIYQLEPVLRAYVVLLLLLLWLCFFVCCCCCCCLLVCACMCICKSECRCVCVYVCVCVCVYMCVCVCVCVCFTSIPCVQRMWSGVAVVCDFTCVRGLEHLSVSLVIAIFTPLSVHPHTPTNVCNMHAPTAASISLTHTHARTHTNTHTQTHTHICVHTHTHTQQSTKPAHRWCRGVFGCFYHLIGGAFHNRNTLSHS